jgi:hypothetical protein
MALETKSGDAEGETMSRRGVQEGTGTVQRDQALLDQSTGCLLT